MLVCVNSDKYSVKKIVKLLLEKGADVNLQNNYGWTALMIVSKNSSNVSTKETIKLLLKNGANIDLQDRHGWTALMHASLCNVVSSTKGTVKLLLKKRIKKEYILVLIIAQIRAMPNYELLNGYIKKLIIIQHNKAKII